MPTNQHKLHVINNYIYKLWVRDGFVRVRDRFETSSGRFDIENSFFSQFADLCEAGGCLDAKGLGGCLIRP